MYWQTTSKQPLDAADPVKPSVHASGVEARPANDLVALTVLGVELVVSSAGVENVPAGVTVQPVVAISCEQVVGAGATAQVISAEAADQKIATFVSRE